MNTTDSEIVDDIIHYLKVNNAGHIDRDNVVDVLIKSIDEQIESATMTVSNGEIDDLEEEIRDLKESIGDAISNLRELI